MEMPSFNITLTLPKVKKISWQEEDINLVKGLLNDWVPNAKPSAALEKLNAEKLEKHKKCEEEMNFAIDRVNQDIETKMRQESTQVKKAIEDIELEARNIISSITFNFKTHIPTGDLNYRKKSLEEIFSLYRNACAKIECLGSTLSNLEHERSYIFSKILKITFAEMLQTAYKLPFELQEKFEQRVLNINQITLNNFRCYNDLCTTLKLKMENNKRLWFEEVDDQVELYEQQLDGSCKDNLEYGKVPVKHILDVDEFAMTVAEKILQYDSEFQAAKKIVKDVVENIFYEDYDYLQYLTVDFHGKPSKDLDTIYEEIRTSLLARQDECELNEFVTEEIAQNWKDFVNELGENVEKCKKITMNAVFLWHNHLSRVFEVRNVFSMDFYDFLKKSLDSEDNLFMELHINVDQLRMSGTEDDLKLAMGQCKKCVDSIGKLMFKNHEKKLHLFDKYREFMKNEADVLTLEMQYFLNNRQFKDDFDPPSFRDSQNLVLETISSDSSKPIIMTEYKADIKALHNWIYGMKIHMEETKNSADNILVQRVEHWIESQMAILTREIQFKQDLHGLLLDRIFHNVYRIRLAEIIWHKVRLAEHENGIKEECKKITNSFKNGTHKLNNLLYLHEQELETLKKRMQSSKSSYLTDIINKQTQALEIKFNETLIQITDGNNSELKRKFDELEGLNLKYLKYIKLLNENGKYEATELKQFKKMVAKASKDLKKEFQENSKKFEVELKSTAVEFQRSCHDLITQSLKMETDYKFEEFIEFESNSTQEKIKELTKDLLGKQKFLSTAVNRLVYLGDLYLGNIEYLDDFTENCEFIEGLFKAIRKIILQPTITKLNSALFKNNLNERVSISNGENLRLHLKNMAAEIAEIAEIKEDANLVQFNMILFKDVKPGDDYMSQIIKLLCDSLEKIQINAKSHFFKMDKESEAFNKLLSFMVDKLATYLYYQLQCEEIALEVSIKCVFIADDFANYVFNYYSKCLNKFKEDKLQFLHCQCKASRRKLKKRRDFLEGKIISLRQQLKPLHGFPKNRNMLNDLCDQMDELQDESTMHQQEMDDLYNHYEQLIENNLNTFIEQVLKIEDRLKTCIQRCTELLATDEVLIEQINEKLNYLLYLMTNEALVENSLEFYSEILNAFTNKINKLKVGLKMASKTFSSIIQKDFSAIKDIKSQYSSDSSDADSKKSWNTFNSSEIFDGFRDAQEKCLSAIKNNKEVLDMFSEHGKLWKNDVEKVLSLYTVKYPIK